MAISEWEARVRAASGGKIGPEITSVAVDENGGRVAYLRHLGYKITGNLGRTIAYIWTSADGGRTYSHCYPFAI